MIPHPLPLPCPSSPLQTDTGADWDTASKMLHGKGLTGKEFDVFMLYSFTPSLLGYSYKVGGAPVSEGGVDTLGCCFSTVTLSSIEWPLLWCSVFNVSPPSPPLPPLS